MTDIRWHTTGFQDLTVQELHDLLRLRVDVFVVEQHCPYPELDGRDADAVHIIGRTPAGDMVAYARVLPPEHGTPHIGRVVVQADHRGRGIARALMLTAIAVARERHGTARSALAAQAHLAPFYASLGYAPASEEYLLDGIPHVDMVREGP